MAAAAAGEYQVWVRSGDSPPAAVTVLTTSTVGDLASRAKEALGLSHTPRLSFAGADLTDPSASLADLGIGAEAQLTVTPRITVTVARGGPQGPKTEVHLPCGATVIHLFEWAAEQEGPGVNQPGGTSGWAKPKRAGMDDSFHIFDPEKPAEPVPSFLAPWRSQCYNLNPDDVLTQCQGFKPGCLIVWYTNDLRQLKKGRPYLPHGGVEVDVVTNGPPECADTVFKRTQMPCDIMQEKAAALWLQQAEDEQGSVASFAALALRLMAHGAPAALLDACLRAGQDEVRHAEVCFGFARELGACGATLPRVLPAHTLEVAKGWGELAARAVHEGAVGEATAAACAAVAAASAECRRVAAAQRMITEDEARHAALAWATAGWAMLQEPREVAAVLESAAAALEGREVATPADCPDAKALLRHGHVEGPEQQRVAARTQALLAIPMLRAMAREQPLPSIANDGTPETLAFCAVIRETAALLSACGCAQ